MIVQPLIRAVNDRGVTVSEVTFLPTSLSGLQDQVESFTDRLHRQCVPFVRIIVDLAVSPLVVSRPPVRPVMHV